MPYSDKSKVISDRVEIYIAARTNDSTPVTLPLQAVVDAGGDTTWKPAGTYEGGKMKLTGESHTVELHDGGLKHLGITAKLEVPLLETDAAKLAVIEGFYGSTVDILCRKLGAYTYHLFKAMTLSSGADFPFDLKSPNKIPLMAQATVSKLSDIYATGTLAAS